ncbi:MAG: transposase [Janthinobacterium lividum]
MQKALTHMNVQLHHVVSDITGLTGMRIIRAIVAGERSPSVLAAMSDRRCKAGVDVIEAALVGNYQPEHLFALSQALAMYDAYQAQLLVCDQQIAQTLIKLSQVNAPPTAPLPKPRHNTRQPNALNFDVRTLLYQLVGVDLTQIHGIGPFLALRLVAECGTDLSRWRTCHHFTSWLTLAPGCRISGGKVLSAHTRKTKNRLTAHLRLAAVTLTSKGQVTLPKSVSQLPGLDTCGKIADVRWSGSVVSRAETLHENAAIGAFLGLLEADIRSGRNLTTRPEDLAQALLANANHSVSLDEKTEGKVAI